MTGATVEEHLDRLDQVLQRLEEHGLKDRVEYLGHIIDKDGLHPVPEKSESNHWRPSSIKRQWA